MKKQIWSFSGALLLFLSPTPIPVHAQGIVNEQTFEKINALMDGPLSTLVSVGMAFLLVTVIVAFIFQLIRLSFNPDLPIIRKDIMNNMASLSAVLVSIGFLMTAGFSWLISLMRRGETQVGSDVLKEEGISASKWIILLGEYKDLASIFFAFASITMVAAFIVQITKLSIQSGNPGDRKKAIGGLAWTGIAAALLGGIALVLQIFVGTGMIS